MKRSLDYLLGKVPPTAGPVIWSCQIGSDALSCQYPARHTAEPSLEWEGTVGHTGGGL